jgi:hypothetical protein
MSAWETTAQPLIALIDRRSAEIAAYGAEKLTSQQRIRIAYSIECSATCFGPSVDRFKTTESLNPQTHSMSAEQLAAYLTAKRAFAESFRVAA